MLIFCPQQICLPEKIKNPIQSSLRWAGHVARMGERRGAYRALVGKPEGRRPLGRPRRRWEDNGSSRRWMGAWTGLIWPRIGTGGGLL
jgi:hypothetical protein